MPAIGAVYYWHVIWTDPFWIGSGTIRSTDQAQVSRVRDRNIDLMPDVDLRCRALAYHGMYTFLSDKALISTHKTPFVILYQRRLRTVLLDLDSARICRCRTRLGLGRSGLTRVQVCLLALIIIAQPLVAWPGRPISAMYHGAVYGCWILHQATIGLAGLLFKLYWSNLHNVCLSAYGRQQILCNLKKGCYFIFLSDISSQFTTSVQRYQLSYRCRFRVLNVS
jgi:hypothetical protein